MPEVKKIATRASYGGALVELGKEYENLYVLDADLAGATQTGMFKKEFPDHTGKILTDTHNGHFLLDLWAAVRITLEEAGVKPSNIHTTDICTCENPDLRFTHRASHGRRGV